MKWYCSIAKPLTKLLQKDGLYWQDQATKAFEDLKMAVIENPILALPNFEMELIVEKDAYTTGIGAV